MSGLKFAVAGTYFLACFWANDPADGVSNGLIGVVSPADKRAANFPDLTNEDQHA